MRLNLIYLHCGIVLLLFVSRCAGIKCFQCSDSGGGGGCILGVNKLAEQRGVFERENATTLRKFPNLKECAYYVDRTSGRPLYDFCKIEVIYAGGSINAYIRDCSDGYDFSADLDLTRLSRDKGYLKPDNQSTCGYSHLHRANMCVQLCDTDFCNGPTAGQNLLYARQSVIYPLNVLTVFFVTFVLRI